MISTIHWSIMFLICFVRRTKEWIQSTQSCWKFYKDVTIVGGSFHGAMDIIAAPWIGRWNQRCGLAQWNRLEIHCPRMMAVCSVNKTSVIFISNEIKCCRAAFVVPVKRKWRNNRKDSHRIAKHSQEITANRSLLPGNSTKNQKIN